MITWISSILMLITVTSHAEPVRRIMPLGDSLTAGGYNLQGQWHVDGGYRTLLCRLIASCGKTIHFVGSLSNGPAELLEKSHEGHSGWRVDQLADGVSSWIDAAKPDLILLLIGTNDIVQNRDLGHLPERFEDLLSRIRAAAPEAELWVANVIPTNNLDLNLKIIEFNETIKTSVAMRSAWDSRIHFVDMYGRAGLTIHDLTDGVHPTALGYDRMARVWYDAIKLTYGTL